MPGRVLTPASPLLEEDTLVLHASGLSSNVYRSILTAVARGDRTPTGISSRTGRPVTALARPIERLTEAGLLIQVPDPVRARRSRYELADPFISFHDAIIRPNRTRIRRRQRRADSKTPEEHCQNRIVPEPPDWKATTFDDSSWVEATVYSKDQVGVKGSYDSISWDSSAKLIWTSDLKVDNTILWRKTVQAQG